MSDYKNKIKIVKNMIKNRLDAEKIIILNIINKYLNGEDAIHEVDMVIKNSELVLKYQRALEYIKNNKEGE